MKEETRSFYEVVVQKTVERIVRGLDEALDLVELARMAGLSPLHFHRIFRGIVGETPLELHRRLRLERAALRLVSTESTIASVAFEAGYETHESFTRAFREAYAASPREFRERAAQPGSRCAPGGLRYELAARCGVHFAERGDAVVRLVMSQGGTVMEVVIEIVPEQRVGAVPHVGPYNEISKAFQRLGEIAARSGLMRESAPAMVAVYHDDPEATPSGELRSDAGVVVPRDVELPKELKELRLTAGRYARYTHVGPYAQLGDAWANFMGGWLPKSGYRAADGLCYELYRNSPMTAQPHDLRTDLYIPLAD